MEYGSRYEGKSFRDFIRFLDASKSVDVRNFHRTALKSLRDFHRECRKGDAVVVTDLNGNVQRHANSVKTRILVPHEHLQLCEVGRVYLKPRMPLVPPFLKDLTLGYLIEALLQHLRPRERVRKMAEKPWAISETRRRTETISTAVFWAFLEELWMWLPRKRIIYRPMMDYVEEHVSSVYTTGVMSIVAMQYAEVHFKRVRWKRGKVVRDGNVRIYLEWRSMI